MGSDPPGQKHEKKGATLPWRLKEVLAIPRAVLEPERRYLEAEISAATEGSLDQHIAFDASLRNEIPFFLFRLTKSR